MILEGLIPALSRARTLKNALGYASGSADFSLVDGLRAPLIAGLLDARKGPQALLAIAELMLAEQSYRFSPQARDAFVRYIAARKTQPLFSNARSIRNALDRVRLRQANRLVADLDRVLTGDDVMTIDAADVTASRVFSKATE